MTEEPRKATEILIELTSKIDILLGIVQAQDLNIKVLSNKLNVLMENLNKQTNSIKPTMEAVHTTQIPQMMRFDDRNIPISSENIILEEKYPKGFRRTSRPETYDKENAVPLTKEKISTSNESIAEIMVPSNITQPINQSIKKENSDILDSQISTIPVVQQILDKNGKSVFLANVEVINKNDGQTITRTRTNGAGRWSAALNPGSYKIIVKKQDNLNKKILETIQDIIVDGNKTPLNLSNCTLK